MAELAQRRLSLLDLVGSPFCVAIDDGQMVHGEITRVLDAGEVAIVSFAGVQRLTTAFLNAAIGQLYNEYEESLVRDRLKVVDLEKSEVHLLKKVVDNAKAFFADPSRGTALVKRLTDEG